MKKNRNNVDMVTGRPWVQLLIFSIPIFMGYLLQNLYNSVDAIVVGNYVGKQGLAAVNATSSITMLLTGFFTGLSTGASVYLAQCFGAQNFKRLKQAIHTTVLLGTILGMIMVVLGRIFCRNLLQVVGCPEDVFDAAAEYLNAYIIGLLFTSLYNVVSGALRAVGDSRSPFTAILIASILNIILDVLLVGYFHMGVVGAAYATIFSQLVSMIYTIFMLCRLDPHYALRMKDLRMDLDIAKAILKLGLPAGIQLCLVSISNMVISRYINSFGSVATSGVGTANRVDQFITMPCQALSLAIATYVSQNVGAKRYDRIMKGFWASCVMAVISLAILGLPLYAKADFIMGMFSQDSEVISYGVSMMRTIIPFYVTMAVSSLLAGLIRGYGYSLEIMIISLIAMVVIRQIYLVVFMAINWNITVVYFSYPVGWISQVILMLGYCIWLRKRGKLGEGASVSIT